MAIFSNWLTSTLRKIVLGIPPNRFHPTVWINGDPSFGKNIYIGGFSIVNAEGTTIEIGDNCDIASYVSINAADSHKRCLGINDEIERKPIKLGRNVFVGSHVVIKGGARIGEFSVVASGCMVDGVEVPPYSLVYGNPMQVRAGYYRDKVKRT